MYFYKILRTSEGWVIQITDPSGVVDYFYRNGDLADQRINQSQSGDAPYAFSMEIIADDVAQACLAGYNYERIW